MPVHPHRRGFRSEAASQRGHEETQRRPAECAHGWHAPTRVVPRRRPAEPFGRCCVDQPAGSRERLTRHPGTRHARRHPTAGRRCPGRGSALGTRTSEHRRSGVADRTGRLYEHWELCWALVGESHAVAVGPALAPRRFPAPEAPGAGGQVHRLINDHSHRAGTTPDRSPARRAADLSTQGTGTSARNGSVILMTSSVQYTRQTPAVAPGSW